jgi:hypothetical protein
MARAVALRRIADVCIDHLANSPPTPHTATFEVQEHCLAVDAEPLGDDRHW